MTNWRNTIYEFTGDKNVIEHLYNIANKNYNNIIKNIWIDMGYGDISEDVFAQYRLWGTDGDICFPSVEIYKCSNEKATLKISGNVDWCLMHDKFIMKACKHYNIEAKVIGIGLENDYFYVANIDKYGNLTMEIETNYLSKESIDYFGIEYFKDYIDNYFESWLENNYSKIELVMLKEKIEEMTTYDKWRAISENKLAFT